MTDRGRLHDLSRFMWYLNEHAQAGGQCRGWGEGAFWEGRFKSQALLDEKALLAAMAYGSQSGPGGLAETPKTSDYTDSRARVVGLPEEVNVRSRPKDHTVSMLMQHLGMGKHYGQKGRGPSLTSPSPADALRCHRADFWAVPFAFEDYPELVD